MEKSASIQKKRSPGGRTHGQLNSPPLKTAVVEGVSPSSPNSPRCSKRERPKDLAALQTNNVLQRWSSRNLFQRFPEPLSEVESSRQQQE